MGENSVERIERLAHAHREPVMLLFDYDRHMWTVWIALMAKKGCFVGDTAEDALRKAEEASDG